MIAGFVSDAHGNPTALEGCLRALKDAGASRLFFLGDAVGYLPEPNAVLDLLRAHDAICIRGNHEAMLLGELDLPESREAAYRLGEARERLSPAHRAWIERWPVRREADLDGRRVLLVHGSPANPLTGYIYPDSNLTSLLDLPFDLIVMGHTHRPFVAESGPLRIVNAGSAGLPRDAGNLAACALYHAADHRAEILRIPFDAERLAARWRQQIDPTVADCLMRRSSGALAGTVLHA